PARTFRSVSVTSGRVFAVDAQGTLWTWGSDLPGPELLHALGTGYQQVQAGAHQCAIETDGTLRCWGASNVYGQLGLGHLSPESVPTRVGTASYVQVAPSEISTCAVESSGSLACWGS